MTQPHIPAEFEQYLIQGEPTQRDKAANWSAAIGLQAVDGLRTSAYLQETARYHIEGNISMDEVEHRIRQYYESQEHRDTGRNAEEADKVATRITQLLSEQTFTFSVPGIASIHRRLFEGVFPHAGQFRTCNISKKEWVLDGESMLYVAWHDIERALNYDLEEEKLFDYSVLSPQQTANHIARFVAKLWQIHPFREGNTRTISLFAIQYLRSLGYQVDNTLFAHHSWYFRNALVRALYRNVKKSISPKPSFLETFFQCLMLGSKAPAFKNRLLHISSTEQHPHVGINVGINVGIKHDSPEARLLDVFRKQPRTTAAQAAKILACTPRQVERLIAALKQKGKLQRIGSKKAGQWLTTL